MISIDGIELRDLSVGGWIGIGISIAGAAWFAEAILYSVFDPTIQLAGGALVAFGGALIAYQNAKPELEDRCATCGDPVSVRSSRDGTDEAVLVRSSETPRRATVGSVSVVLSRRKAERVYCSGECADADERPFLGELASVSTRAPEPDRATATDGGEP